MPAGPIYAQYQIIHYNGGKVENKTAHVVTEKPLTVFLNHNELSINLFTGGTGRTGGGLFIK